QSWPTGTAEAQRALTPRDDLVEEVVSSTNGASTTDAQCTGPVISYERTTVDNAASVDETIRYRLVIPWFGWLFALPVRNTLRRRPAEPSAPLWAPPGRLATPHPHS